MLSTGVKFWLGHLVSQKTKMHSEKVTKATCLPLKKAQIQNPHDNWQAIFGKFAATTMPKLIRQQQRGWAGPVGICLG